VLAGTGDCQPGLRTPARAPYISAMHPTVRVIDLETTGSRPPDDGVVEVGWQDVSGAGEADWEVTAGRGALFVNPQRPIPSRTAAVHHIIDADVAGSPPWHVVAPPILLAPGLIALAAHRVEFERRWCVDALTGGLPWVCTYKCALRLWPDMPSHSNQALRYERMPAGLDRALGLPAHRAGPDAYVTAHHLRDMLNEASLDQLIAWSREPALLVRVPFGPFRGRRWADLDDTALDAILARDTDRDMRFTARHERDRRNGAGPAPTPQAMLLL